MCFGSWEMTGSSITLLQYCPPGVIDVTRLPSVRPSWIPSESFPYLLVLLLHHFPLFWAGSTTHQCITLLMCSLPYRSDLLNVCTHSYFIAKSTAASYMCGDCYCCCLVQVLWSVDATARAQGPKLSGHFWLTDWVAAVMYTSGFASQQHGYW